MFIALIKNTSPETKLFIVSIVFDLFFFNDPATTEIYTLSLHDALPISRGWLFYDAACPLCARWAERSRGRSEEHTSELQSRLHLVCRLLLEKKKKQGLVRHRLVHHSRLVAFHSEYAIQIRRDTTADYDA